MARPGPTKTTYNDDIITGWVGVGSQLDGLGHIGVDHVYYNCNKATDFAAADGLRSSASRRCRRSSPRRRARHDGGHRKNPVPAGTPFNKKEIDDALAKQGIQIRKGDVVLFHTGWQDWRARIPRRSWRASRAWARKAPSIWLKDVLAIGADQWGLEVVPFEKGVGVFEVHQILLPRNGSTSWRT